MKVSVPDRFLLVPRYLGTVLGFFCSVEWHRIGGLWWGMQLKSHKRRFRSWEGGGQTLFIAPSDPGCDNSFKR